MHIEPGVLDASKIAYANAAAIATLGAFAPKLLVRPLDIAKTAAAAAFFSVFMEVFHMPVGPSELHFVGASAVYLTFGFLPTLFGFAIGLALQGLLFEHQDLVHLGVNSLSLMAPLIATHALIGRRFFAGATAVEAKWSTIVRFDALYYAGVVGMVGFWLALGREATPVADWGRFALSYLPLVLLEPVFTWGVLRLTKRFDSSAPVRALTETARLRVA